MTHPPFFDNKASIVKDDLVSTIRSGDRVSVAAEVFSMYAYQELKEQLDGLDEFRFIFTSQAFTRSRPPPSRSGSSTSPDSPGRRGCAGRSWRSASETS
ncbi:hypothetical protein VXJ25_07970 [Olsenella sp. YH-ols2223]|uniref:Uncharacterized protein n=1 Tax=Olsenella absiana TaxID=3115222 RepID=A0ABU7RBM9_9ACTN